MEPDVLTKIQDKQDEENFRGNGDGRAEGLTWPWQGDHGGTERRGDAETSLPR